MAEDAYITFRVVENFFQGFGLVFNPGENIEASTHPLWVMLLILGRALDISVPFVAIFWNLVLTLSGIALLTFRDNRFYWAAITLSCISGFRDFSTSGMEFSLVFFLMVLFYTSLEKYSLRERPAFYAAILASMYLTRPELALLSVYYSGCFLYDIWKSKPFSSEIRNVERYYLRSFFNLVKWGVVFVLIAGGWHLFRYLYYGEVFPNTYYAKSGSGGYYLQGLKYFISSFGGSYALWPSFLLASSLIIHRFRKIFSHREAFSLMRDFGAFAMLTFYVVRLGGDFMAFRFLLPEIVLFALIADRIFHKYATNASLPNNFLVRQRRFLPLLVTIIFFASSFIPTKRISGYIADERRIYLEESSIAGSFFPKTGHLWGKKGSAVGEFASCIGVDNLWIANSQYNAQCMKGIGLGYFGYSSGPQVKILDEQGLSDASVARMPILMRYRPGHEHFTPLPMVIEKGAAFCNTGEVEYDRVMQTQLGVVIRLDPEFLRTLPNARLKLARLIELKRQGSLIIPQLEKRYGWTVEDLYQRSFYWPGDDKNCYALLKDYTYY